MAGLAMRVVSKVLELVVILAVLRSGAKGFEGVALASLVLIYLSVQNGLAAIGRGQVELAVKSSRQFLKLATALHDPAIGQYSESLEETEATFARLQDGWRVELAFASIAWVVTLWSLLASFA